ncbi:MAG TPA: hypothetical protein VE449_03055 [Thermoleophilaceae bacterium]|nr:hypothetical protein [Thermoleophilaceae bacterium]
MGDYGLIDPEAASGSLDTGEARRHRSRHNDTSHFDPAVDDDFLDVMAEVRHGGNRVPPNRLLIVDRGGGKTERRVDYHVAVQQLIEGVEIARITGSQPSEHHRLASIDHRTKLTGPAPRGASVDVFGLRSNEIPDAVRQSVIQEYPRLGFKREFAGLLRAEAKQVPRGRAWYLHRFAMSDLSIRLAPFRD